MRAVNSEMSCTGVQIIRVATHERENVHLLKMIEPQLHKRPVYILYSIFILCIFRPLKPQQRNVVTFHFYFAEIGSGAHTFAAAL